MSILIKGMEMPKEGCLIVRIYANGEVCEPTECAGTWGKVATATPVLPHGDLIDRDRAVRDLRMDYAYAAARIVVLQPTIIPAEEEV